MSITKRIFVSKGFKFEAAHKLPHYIGKCANLHGHTYLLRVTVSGLLSAADESGIVLDFGIIKEVVNKAIIDTYDHKYLNDFFQLPSAEVMVARMWDELQEAFRAHPRWRNTMLLEEVRLNEGGGENWASVHRFFSPEEAMTNG